MCSLIVLVRYVSFLGHVAYLQFSLTQIDSIYGNGIYHRKGKEGGKVCGELNFGHYAMCCWATRTRLGHVFDGRARRERAKAKCLCALGWVDCGWCKLCNLVRAIVRYIVYGSCCPVVLQRLAFKFKLNELGVI